MMELETRGFGDVDGALCLAHIVDVSLAHRLAENVTEWACSFCERKRDPDAGAPFAVPFEAFVSELMETIHYFYSDANAVLSWDGEDQQYVGPQSETWEVVDDIASAAFDINCGDAIIEAVIEAIGDDTTWTEWSSPAELDDLDFAWGEFAQTARHHSRFVFVSSDDPDSSTPMARYLKSLLVYVSEDLDLVVDLPPGSAFYRGRLCEDPSKLTRQSRDLGPAPDGRASANRMSPAGISLFYASGDDQTAVAEIAGHGVEPFAVIGRFTNLRPLRVLDLTRKPPTISPFDQERRERARMGRFLKSFVEYVTAPVIPDGRQHVEYAPTQVLTEFFRWVPRPRLDGIALPSAATGKPTYVLFFGPGACRTEGDPAVATPVGLLGMGLPDDGAVFTLDPDDVTTYRVERTYAGTEAGPWFSAARRRP